MDEARSTEQRAAADAAKRQAGQYAGDAGTAYSPETLRALMNADRITDYRNPMQNALGQMLSRPNDDGTVTAGTWGIDEWGRVVAL